MIASRAQKHARRLNAVFHYSRTGLRFDAEMERAGQRGFRSVRQIVIDKAEGDFVWDLDGNRYIDFQNGWATNPLGNCHPEILEAVDAVNPPLWLPLRPSFALRPG